ncbi:MAG: HepT-like ribonuclease domain-containing protein [Rhizomicrobium sp.]
MIARSVAAHLTDILDAIGNIHGTMEDMSLEGLEADWQKRWIVERGVEIVSEASRRIGESE